MRGTQVLVVATLLLVSTVGVLPATGAQSFSDGGQQSAAAPHEHKSVNNWTSTWRDGDVGDSSDPSDDPWGTENPQYPGNKDVSFVAFSRGFPSDLTPIGNLTVIFPQAQGNHCQITQARAFGIDRDDDESGTTTNEPLLNFHANPQGTRNGSQGGLDDGKNWTNYDFYNEGEGFQDQTIDLFTEDEITASLADCYRQPRTPGWYRWIGGLNGSIDGDPEDASGGDWKSADWFGDDPDEQAFVYSHWYYICQCSNRQDAIDKMGPPPTQDQTAPVLWAEEGPLRTEVTLAAYDVDGDGIPDEVTNDKTTDPADYWSSDTGDGYEAGNWEERQARADNGGGSTATATPTATATETEGPTPTETEGPTPTETEGPTATATATPTETEGPTTTEQQNTNGGGPGFGMLVALGALLGAALLALRRR